METNKRRSLTIDHTKHSTAQHATLKFQAEDECRAATLRMLGLAPTFFPCPISRTTIPLAGGLPSCVSTAFSYESKGTIKAARTSTAEPLPCPRPPRSLDSIAELLERHACSLPITDPKDQNTLAKPPAKKDEATQGKVQVPKGMRKKASFGKTKKRQKVAKAPQIPTPGKVQVPKPEEAFPAPVPGEASELRGSTMTPIPVEMPLELHPQAVRKGNHSYTLSCCNNIARVEVLLRGKAFFVKACAPGFVLPSSPSYGWKVHGGIVGAWKACALACGWV